MPLSRTLRFRRRLFIAGAVVGLILLATFYLVFHNSAQAAARNDWVAHSQEVLTVISRARLAPAGLQNQVWAFRSTHDAELPRRFPDFLQSLSSDIHHLREITADNPAQQVVLAELTPILSNQMASLEQAMRRAVLAPDEHTDLAFDWSLPTPLSDHVQRLFQVLESNERSLLAARTGAVRNSVFRDNMIFLSAATLTFAVLAFAGWLVSRELVTRAELQVGIGEAAELLGVKYEDQRTKLGHAIRELNVQIRKRQHAEADLQILNGELEKRVDARTLQLQEANNELETFSYAVSHDLRAPLRHMEGFSHFLRQKYGPGLPPEAQHYLDRIRAATTHMSDLVEGLLQLSHAGAQPQNMLPVSLQALFEEARSKMQPELLKREIDWRVGALPEVLGDSVVLAQVFANLLSNAVKFTRLQPHAIIEAGSCEKNGESVVFVRDNGVGFNPDFAAKLFGVFQRLHRQDEFEGTGIGLATVQRIIRRHGGRIWAESIMGQGATFFFTLPAPQKIITEMDSLVGAAA
ncbi:MAG: ATP-binding protein [Candidatus Acidiferrum sp.]